jgi:hypothetical protein
MGQTKSYFFNRGKSIKTDFDAWFIECILGCRYILGLFLSVAAVKSESNKYFSMLRKVKWRWL